MLRMIIDRITGLKEIKESLFTLRKESRELVKAQVFRDSIIGVDWVRNKSFSPSGAAANYSFLYILFRVLQEVQPASIIEFGVGQTSKLTSQYIAFKNTAASLWLVEHSEQWLNIFSEYIEKHPHVHQLRIDKELFVYRGFETYRYKNLLNRIDGQSFDVIINDGPEGCERYSRNGILELIPNNLKKRFVFIIDDCDRQGERETALEVMNKLKECEIAFDFSLYKGIKEQYIIYSKDLAFLKTL